ncbi:PREDICTED: pancreatic secretory granule membrane major glycoprotein GP2 [Condylura cristata]|uniref:pancreatic secretory granule membrane major glycoprotein GP2 n=1 Tax=Condylura cristata TaxID=143302 RepID=UPI0003344D4E|nr:PREDICTED: pancreatic secretory granule membrane major glycoprotein GP2 [Condylura cristata]
MRCVSWLMEKMGGSSVLWLALASCILASAPTQQEGSRNWAEASSYGLDMDCGAPGTPEAHLCFDPCQNYTVLDEPFRSIENAGETISCDNTLFGWYRFVGEGGDRMPETCIPPFRCQAASPMWLNGTHPSVGEGIVNRTVCAHWSGNCCLWKSQVQVKSCPGQYYVYHLHGTPECDLKYCTESVNVSVNCDKTCRPEEECKLSGGVWDCFCRQNLDNFDVKDLQPQLDCGAKEIKVSVDKCHLKALGFGDDVFAFLNDRNCNSVMQREERNWISVTSPTQGATCGSTLEKNATHAIYKNTLSLGNDIITRDTILNIDFQCAYPLDMDLSLQMALKPIVSSLNISMDGRGEFVVRMALFQDLNYTSPFQGTEAVLSVESMLYVGAILEKGDTSHFNLLLQNCYATPTNNKNDPLKYFIIKNGCPNRVDSTISVTKNGISSESQFSVQMFMFVGNYDLVFLHCEIQLCDSDNQQCQPSCSRNELRNEITSINPDQVLDLGPITRKGGPSLGLVSGSSDIAGTLATWPMLLLPALLARLF